MLRPIDIWFKNNGLKFWKLNWYNKNKKQRKFSKYIGIRWIITRIKLSIKKWWINLKLNDYWNS